MGAFRPRPQDGYSPVVRDYDTGLPTQGVKVEEKKTEVLTIMPADEHPAGIIQAA
ncbi:sulfatase family protein [Escherichia coli]|uniref:Sulfatase family protein n=1 Tax=Escherichia coli TaxID=562 RepID=A0A2X3K1U4_ECOLX|nr:sulfatase family protein [Escherichia coli]